MSDNYEIWTTDEVMVIFLSEETLCITYWGKVKSKALKSARVGKSPRKL